MRRLALLAAPAALLLALASPASAALRFCSPSERECAKLTVPLDRSGAVPGEIGLQVERRPARKPTRPPLVLLAGGPGQGATYVFGNDGLTALLGPERTQRHLIVFDQRGTGDSGPIDCTRLQKGPISDLSLAGLECANQLGPRRAFFTTRDSAEDIEAIRRELGVPKIALMGTSYGTKVALAYALAHPGNVDRMILDSVVPANGPNMLTLETMQATPRVLRRLCRRSCRRFTRDPVADLAALSARLARGPLHGRVIDRRGHAHSATLRNADLITLIVGGDFDGILRLQTPGLLHAARRGDVAPILRAVARAEEDFGTGEPPKVFSNGTYAATTCEEGVFPWPRTAPAADRRRLLDAYVAALPPSALGPFDRDAARTGDGTRLCLSWPTTAKAPALGPGPLPDVPVLLLAGGQDTRTPVENALKVAAGFRQSTLITVGGVGHDVVGQTRSTCPTVAIRRFLAGGAPGRCRGQSAGIPIPPPPRSLGRVRRVRGVPGRPGRTLTAVRFTLADAIQSLVASIDAAESPLEVPDAIRGGGLRGGTFSFGLASGRAAFRRLSFVPGVTIAGAIRHFGDRGQRGRLRVRGRAAAHGTLKIAGRHVTGRLGRRRIDVRLAIDGESLSGAVLARASSRPPLR